MQAAFKNVSFFIILLAPITLFAQVFTWLHGDSTKYAHAYYGTKGVSSSATKPGSRQQPACWKDAAGNLWLFGGMGLNASAGINNGLLNDFWKYNPVSNQWTWIGGFDLFGSAGNYGTQGVADVANIPGARYSALTWTDASGNFWLYGGAGMGQNGPTDHLTDLWKYNVNTNQWTWVHGDPGTQISTALSPGPRMESVTWVDAVGDLWLYGGTTLVNNTTLQVNDLWKYNIAANSWTYINGNSQAAEPPIYGTQAVFSPANTPGARGYSKGWADASGNLWLFGGSFFNAVPIGSSLYYNDVWKYNVATNQWAWIKGSSTPNQPASYGTQNQPAVINTPGGRNVGSLWRDATENVYIFGGNNNDVFLGDIWKYDPLLNEWTWLGGDTLGNAARSYGTQGIAAMNNTPGSRGLFAYWSNAGNNTLYVMGGAGIHANHSLHSLNDLWKLDFCAPDAPVISSADPVLCSGQTTTLTAAGAINFIWNTGQSGQQITIVTSVTTTYTVTGETGPGCLRAAVYKQDVVICTGIDEKSSGNVTRLYPNPNNGQFTISLASVVNTKFLLYNTTGQMVLEQILTSETTDLKTELTPGIYYYTILQSNEPQGRETLVIE